MNGEDKSPAAVEKTQKAKEEIIDGWDKEALVKEANIQNLEAMQTRILKNAAIIGEPRFQVAMHILANTVTANAGTAKSKVENALKIADEFIEGYNE